MKKEKKQISKIKRPILNLATQRMWNAGLVCTKAVGDFIWSTPKYTQSQKNLENYKYVGITWALLLSSHHVIICDLLCCFAICIWRVISYHVKQFGANIHSLIADSVAPSESTSLVHSDCHLIRLIHTWIIETLQCTLYTDHAMHTNSNFFFLLLIKKWK